MPPKDFTPEEVQRFEQEYTTGTMDAPRRQVWERLRPQYVSTPEPPPRLQAVAEPLTPAQYRWESEQPPRTPEGSHRRLLLELGTPLALALLTRDVGTMRTVWQRAAQLGLTAALGTFLGSEAAEQVDPTATPHTSALRKGAEAGGAAFGGGIVPYAAPQAGYLARLGYGGLRMLGAGGGAAGGSLASEVFDPSIDPLARARHVGTTVAGFQGGQSLVGSLVPKPRGLSLSPLGREAAETMQQEGVTIPSSVSESKVWRASEHQGERSVVGGRYLERAWRQAREQLSNAADSLLRQIRSGRTQAQVEQTTTTMYNALNDLSDMAMGRATRPIFTADIAQRARDVLPFLGRGSAASSPLFARLHGFAAQLSTAPEQMPKRNVDLYARRGNSLLLAATNAGVPTFTLERIRDLTQAIHTATRAETIVDMRGLRPVFDDLRALATRFLPDSAERTLLTRVAQTEHFITLDEARALRSDLLEIGRMIPTEGVRLGRFRGSLGYVANQLEEEVDTSLAKAYRGLGLDVEGAWREANQARKLQAQVARLGALVESSKDQTTGVLNGQTLLRKLTNPEDVRALGTLAPPQVEQLRRLAMALAFHQISSGTGLRSYVEGTAMPHMELGHVARGLGPFQFAAAGLVATGHPILGFLSALTPELTGYVLSKPSITTALAMGLQMDPTSPHYAALASRLVGLLSAEHFGEGHIVKTPVLREGAPAETRQAPGTP